MKRDRRILGGFLATVLFVFFAISVLITLFFGGFLPGIFFILLFYGWVVYAFLRYREARQSELLQVLAASVEAKLPLAPALQAYVDERPHDVLHEFCEAFLLHMVVFPYYWVWHRGRSFDDRVANLAHLLKTGVPLSEALKEIPAVANHETRVAVAIGEATGQLATCLRR